MQIQNGGELLIILGNTKPEWTKCNTVFDSLPCAVKVSNCQCTNLVPARLTIYRQGTHHTKKGVHRGRKISK